MENQKPETKELTAAEQFEALHGKISNPEFDFKKLNGVTKEDYNAAIAKANGKRIYHLRVAIDAEEYYDFLAVRPTTATLRALDVARKDKQNGDEKVADLMIKNCLLNPNYDILEDGTVFAGVIMQLSSFTNQIANFIMKA